MYHYYMFYKPFGYVTAKRDERYPVVMEYFKELENEKLNPVGRLDRETEGLLLITDDGKWNQEMTHPKFQKEKKYEFIVLGDLTEEKVKQLEQGVLLIGEGVPTAQATIVIEKKSVLAETLPLLHPEIQEKSKHNRPEHPVTYGTIVISEGRKRQIRRMMKAVGCCVLFLKRISMGDIVLEESLKAGEWKEIKLSLDHKKVESDDS